MAQAEPADARSWTEGRSGLHPTYREWLYPPFLVIVLVLALCALVGVAYGAAYGATLGWASGLLLGAIGLALLLATSTRLRVDEHVVQAGRARIPLGALGEATPLDREAMRQARSFADPRDYLVLRAWSSRQGVAIPVTDPRDPHPCWIVTSRHPRELARAINAARSHRPG